MMHGFRAFILACALGGLYVDDAQAQDAAADDILLFDWSSQRVDVQERITGIAISLLQELDRVLAADIADKAETADEAREGLVVIQEEIRAAISDLPPPPELVTNPEQAERLLSGRRTMVELGDRMDSVVSSADALLARISAGEPVEDAQLATQMLDAQILIVEAALVHKQSLRSDDFTEFGTHLNILSVETEGAFLLILRLRRMDVSGEYDQATAETYLAEAGAHLDLVRSHAREVPVITAGILAESEASLPVGAGSDTPAARALELMRTLAGSADSSASAYEREARWIQGHLTQYPLSGEETDRLKATEQMIGSLAAAAQQENRRKQLRLWAAGAMADLIRP